MSRLAALAVLVFAPLAAAADKPKPAFTEKDLADGWVTLFDGETTYGWTVQGDAKIEDHTLILKEKASFTYSLPLPPGELRIGGRGSNPVSTGKHAGGVVKFDTPSELNAIHFKPDNTKPLFNGKDLSGWKVFSGDEKRNKSKFEVTKAGEIHLTNGPGDLQTEGKYADFVLQLEFKTNGDGLNSGVFFRCIPDQYQNGYECQIHNGFKGNDRAKPSDFGTGAIYRRIAARKVVANDGEWTHLTLVARGPTFATWVNGYPVCVWTDERAKDENPRKGLRLDAGHLSIQGHDPTTDLLFRNLRLAEIGK
jgi:hypothetical protein